MSVIELTNKEIKVLLKGFGGSDFFENENSIVWSNSISTDKIKGKELSGIVSSLVKKGVMGSQDDGKDSTLWLTQRGKEIFIELKRMQSIK